PSTKSLFTGQYYPWKGEMKLPEEGPATLAELFQAAGYRTGIFTGNGNISPQAGNIRGFETFARRRAGVPLRSAYHDDSEKVHPVALDWVDGLDPGDKVFIYLHVVHPHAPYAPPEPFLGEYTRGHEDSTISGSKDTLKFFQRQGSQLASPADRRRIKSLYRASLAYSDHHLGRFLDGLRQRYPEREILTVVTSDHGEELFDHQGVLHGDSLYQHQLRVPLIVHWPERLEPRRLEGDLLTDTIDVHQTLRDLLGEGPGPHLGEGRSLWPILSGLSSEPVKDVSFASKPGSTYFYFAARSRRYKLIWAPRDGEGAGMGSSTARTYDLEYVFDLQEDPQERVNLAGETPLEVEWLRSRLHGWLTRAESLETGEEITGLDEETLAILKALGYVD
ncbi:MAG: sulfatase-like hydrolase/transferase, partial [Acidobacteriota bacterium]